MARKDPLETAKEKGRQGRRDGLAIGANPYPDTRTGRGAITWSRSFLRAWADGWREADKEASS